ncbi:MAG: PAS domain S-box protein [SAR324 cluster bacterium]|nr:PAS domain S-box protein [SAR324 cluster bacterium]
MQDEEKTREQILEELNTLKKTNSMLKDWAFLKANTIDAITIQDFKGNIRAWNKGAENMYGFKEAEALQMNISTIVPPEKSEEALDFIKQLQTEEVESFETKRLTKDGKILDVWITVTPLTDDEGNPYGVGTTERDVTQRNLIRTELYNEKEWFKVTLSSLGDAVVATDSEGAVTFMNNVAETLTGWNVNEAHGTPLPEIFNIVNDLTRSRVENPVEKVLRTNGVVGLANHTILIAKDGTEYFIDDSGAPIRDKEKNIIGVVLVFRDISEKRKLEQKMIQSQKLEAIGTLAGGIAHDFNNLLTPIMGYSDMIRMGLPPDSQESQYAKNILASSVQAKNLVEKILTVTRSSLEKTETVQLNTIVNEVLTILRASTHPSIVLRQENDFDLPQISADPSQMYQLVLNLCTNAIQAMGESGELVIKLDVVRYHPSFHDHPSSIPLLCLSVQDNGCGIDKKTLQRIYEPFFTTKQRGEHRGTGLGLSIVSNIVKNHQGFLEVESEPDVGTIFRTYFPSIETHETRSAETLVETPENSFETSRDCIMLVDDDPMVNQLGTSILKKLGYQVESFLNAHEALKAFEAAPEKFQLILTDYTMPNVTGPQLIKQVKAIRSDIPVLIITGYSNLATPENYKEWRCDGFVKKPFDVAKLSNAVRQVLANAKTRATVAKNR